MKKKLDGIYTPRACISQILLKMKLLTIALLVTLAVQAANSYSQVTRFSLKFSETTVKEVFKHIEENSEFIFLYNENIVDINRKVDVNVKDETVETILEQVFKGTEYAWKVYDRQVVIFKNKEKAVPAVNKESALSDHFEQSPQPQRREVTGTVKDNSGLPLPGVTVVVKGTSVGSITNNDGRYSIQVPADARVLVFSFVGMKTQEVTLDNRNAYEIVMVEETIGLDEVVAIGYGTQKRVTITGAVTSVESEELKKVPAANVANALTGRLSGVTFIQQSGEPGADDPIIRIRGISTLGDPLGAGNNPLVLVDGVERNFSRLDPEEIESVSVLKDAASTAVYGVRGANGVILITTKRGLAGKPKLTYSAQMGLQQPAIHLKYTDAFQYATLVNEGQANDGIGEANRTFSPAEIEKYRTKSDPWFYPDMDWMDYLLRKVAPQHKHNLNIQGGADKLRYFVSLGVLDQDGIFKRYDVGDYDPNFTFTRYNFRSNFDFDVTNTTRLKVTAGGNAGSRNGPNDTAGGNGHFWFDLQQDNPMISLGIIDGKRVVSEDRRGRAGALNDLYFTGFENVYTSDFNMDANLSQKLDMLVKGLRIHGTVAYDSHYSHTKRRDKGFPTYYPRVHPDKPGEIVLIKKGQEGGMGFNESYGKWKKLYSEVALNYENSFNNHNVSALALYNQQKRWYPSLSQSDIPTAYLGFVGRLTYNYSLKYLFDFNLGYNGSENFAPGKRFGLFPAVSVGWVASEEAFFKTSFSFIDYLKFRYSFGMVGQDNLGSQRFYYLPDRYAFTGGYFWGTSTTMSPGARESSLGNPDVGWEVARKQNAAVEIKTLKQRLSIVAEYFTENRTDILINRRTVPAVMAATLPPQNLGKVDNWGYELEAKWMQNFNKFRYHIGGNFAHVKNKIIFNDEPLGNYEYQWETGKPVGQHFGYEFVGFFKDQADIDSSPLYYAGTKPGDVKYRDVNGDGEITTADITAISSPKYPVITYGINGGLSYGDFDFSMLFQGAAKVSIELTDEFIIPYINDGPVMKYIWEERWTPETADKATYPRMISSPTRDHNNYMPSSLWIRDASYLRLKNVDLGYTFRNRSFTSRLGIENMRIGLNGVNLLTFTPLTVSDPEARSGRTQMHPTMKVYNFTLNVQF